MQRILVRHLSGGREGQVDEFPAGDYELTVGRDPSSHVRFDADQDDLVSRQHVKITRDARDPNSYQLIDLQSRNGAFLNRQRVFGSALIHHNDVIQLGAGGPEFRFEFDPPPLTTTSSPLESPMGFAAASQPGVKATRESWLPDPQGKSQPVGRATVERMLGDVVTRVKKKSNQSVWTVSIAAVAGIALLGFGTYYFMRSSQAELQSNLSQAQAVNTAGIARVEEELKKSPAALEEAKQQVARLEAQLQESNNRNEANHRDLLSALEAARRQTASLERSLKQVQAKGSAPGQGTLPGLPPIAPKADAVDPGNYEALRQEAERRIAEGRAGDASELTARLIQLDNQRWEGYALAGKSAAGLGDHKLAVEMYNRALARAPQRSRPAIEGDLKASQDLVQR